MGCVVLGCVDGSACFRLRDCARAAFGRRVKHRLNPLGKLLNGFSLVDDTLVQMLSQPVKSRLNIRGRCLVCFLAEGQRSPLNLVCRVRIHH